MKRLLILEGPDRVGKTTLLDKISKLVPNTFVVKQPSGSNSVGFLRGYVKSDAHMTPFERQLLHTVSHVVDLFEEPAFSPDSKDSLIIMDRSFVSQQVYGLLQNIPKDKLEILFKIHSSSYGNLVKNQEIQVNFVLVDREYPFPQQEDDYYERTLSWNKLRDGFLSYFLEFNKKIHLREDEKFNIIRNDQTPEEGAKKILRFLGESE